MEVGVLVRALPWAQGDIRDVGVPVRILQWAVCRDRSWRGGGWCPSEDTSMHTGRDQGGGIPGSILPWTVYRERSGRLVSQGGYFHG